MPTFSIEFVFDQLDHAKGKILVIEEKDKGAALACFKKELLALPEAESYREWTEAVGKLAEDDVDEVDKDTVIVYEWERGCC